MTAPFGSNFISDTPSTSLSILLAQPRSTSTARSGSLSRSALAPPPRSAAARRLEALLPTWQAWLGRQAAEGHLSAAAQEALQLAALPEGLQRLSHRLEAGIGAADLPPVQLLPAAVMGAAVGAYAAESGQVYLNADWLRTAPEAAVLAVLSEEFGHHLDHRFNRSDTAGDEGARFAALLAGAAGVQPAQRQERRDSDDHGQLQVDGRTVAVEYSDAVAITLIRPASPGRTYREWRNESAFAALKSNGSVITWGEATSGGDSRAVAQRLSSGVTQIFSTARAFAALRSNGGVITWGEGSSGGDSSSVATRLGSGVRRISSNASAFAALKNNGSVITWGEALAGGDSSAVADRLTSGVSQIVASERAFAALKTNGSVVSWGSFKDGVSDHFNTPQLNSGVSRIFSTHGAFAALKLDGSVVTWGESRAGGDSNAVASRLVNGVIEIYSTDRAFAALKSDGAVVTWGEVWAGGDSSAVADRLFSGVTQIASTNHAFAALKVDGSVVSWGSGSSAGDSRAVAGRLSSGVSQIFSNDYAFAALKSDGSLVTWGASEFGGDSRGVASRLRSGVVEVVGTNYAFAALKDDGSVVTWGFADFGGNSSAVASQLRSGVRQIFANDHAFAALKEDGSLVTWGSPLYGGDSRELAGPLSSGVVGVATPFSDDRLTPQPLTEITVFGRQLLLQFAEPIVSTDLSTHRFTATVLGAPIPNRVITAISVDPTRPSLLTLTLSGIVPTSDEIVQLNYTDLTPADDESGVIQDAAGIDLASFNAPGRYADTFKSVIDVYSLAGAYANLKLTGNARIATGNASSNRIDVDEIKERTHVIIGAGGIDRLDGGNGADIYVVNLGAEHRAAEFNDSGSSGEDEVRFSSSLPGDTLTLFAGDLGIEKVTIAGGLENEPDFTGTTPLNINAIAAPNPLMIFGNAGINRITGTAFVDRLDGKEGSDLYIVNDGSDHGSGEITDSGLTGRDRILFAPSVEGDVLVVSAGDSGVEQIQIRAISNPRVDLPSGVNATAAINPLAIVGNESTNSIIGTAFADQLSGGGRSDTLAAGPGPDRLNGNDGNDILTGGLGPDLFRFDAPPNATTNKDVITDFSPLQGDRIELASAIFVALQPIGVLNPAALQIGPAATAVTHRILYNNISGLLSYDSNGSRPGEPVPIAVLPAGLASVLTAESFRVI